MNAYAARARRLKARAIASLIMSELSPELRRDPLLPDLVESVPSKERLRIAKAANAHPKSRRDDLPPSAETWKLVVDEIQAFTDRYAMALV